MKAGRERTGGTGIPTLYAPESVWALISTKSGPERQKFSICRIKNSKAFVSRNPSRIARPSFRVSPVLSPPSLSHVSLAN